MVVRLASRGNALPPNSRPLWLRCLRARPCCLVSCFVRVGGITAVTRCIDERERRERQWDGVKCEQEDGVGAKVDVSVLSQISKLTRVVWATTRQPLFRVLPDSHYKLFTFAGRLRHLTTQSRCAELNWSFALTCTARRRETIPDNACSIMKFVGIDRLSDSPPS